MIEKPISAALYTPEKRQYITLLDPSKVQYMYSPLNNCLHETDHKAIKNVQKRHSTSDLNALHPLFCM